MMTSRKPPILPFPRGPVLACVVVLGLWLVPGAQGQDAGGGTTLDQDRSPAESRALAERSAAEEALDTARERFASAYQTLESFVTDLLPRRSQCARACRAMRRCLVAAGLCDVALKYRTAWNDERRLAPHLISGGESGTRRLPQNCSRRGEI